MAFSLFLEYVFAGLTYGCIYAIVAIGFNIIYNTTGIINFAQGEFVMLGGMTAISLNTIMPLPVAIALSVLIVGCVGALLQLAFIRPLKNASVLRMIVITIGLSIIIKETALHIWDEKVRALPYFIGDETTSLSIVGAHISPQTVCVFVVCVLMVLLLTIFFKFTFVGKQMRSCAANPVAARLCGVPADNLVMLSFIISAAMGAMAGCVISPIAQTQYDCGTNLAVKGFTVAVLGGIGNSFGAVLGGIILGLLESLSVCMFPSAYKDAVSLILLLIILIIKPSGLFGNATVAKMHSEGA